MFKASGSTIVTAYFQLESKHGSNEYDSWISNIFSLQDSMVIFTTPSLLENFKKRREFASDRTHIVALELESVPVAKNYTSDFWTKQLDMDYEKSIHRSYKLFWVWLSKSWFVQEAARLNPFLSDNFIWTDIGSFRGATYINQRLVVHADVIPESSILVQCFQAPHFPTDPWVIKIPATINNGTFFVAGALLAGKLKTWQRFSSAISDTIQAYINKGLFVGEDQAIIESVCLQIEHMCAYITPDQVLGDVWFGLQDVLYRSGNATALLWQQKGATFTPNATNVPVARRRRKRRRIRRK